MPHTSIVAMHRFLQFMKKKMSIRTDMTDETLVAEFKAYLEQRAPLALAQDEHRPSHDGS
jgi:hypothetical protein